MFVEDGPGAESERGFWGFIAWCLIAAGSCFWTTHIEL